MPTRTQPASIILTGPRPKVGLLLLVDLLLLASGRCGCGMVS
jgi:hypothetical protein